MTFFHLIRYGCLLKILLFLSYISSAQFFFVIETYTIIDIKNNFQVLVKLFLVNSVNYFVSLEFPLKKKTMLTFRAKFMSNFKGIFFTKKIEYAFLVVHSPKNSQNAKKNSPRLKTRHVTKTKGKKRSSGGSYVWLVSFLFRVDFGGWCGG